MQFLPWMIFTLGIVHVAPGAAADRLLTIPAPFEREHHALHARLEAAMHAGGRTGEAAKRLEAVLQPHFVKEERWALPPLGALPALARGEIGPAMKPVMEMAIRFKAELPAMLAEHKQIVSAAQALRDAARQEGKPEYTRLVDDLLVHAQSEEEIQYPTTVMIGDYLKLRLH